MKILYSCLFFLMNITAYTQTVALHRLVYEIRNPKTDAFHFRSALESIGEYLALNVLEELPCQETSIQTLTGKEAVHPLPREMPVLVTILRAGLPLNAGVQKVFPNAEVGFFAMARNEETLKAVTSYVALPNLEDRYVILSDTMIGTGGSIIDAISILEKRKPKKIFVIAAIASQLGVDRILEAFPQVTILRASTDPYLNDKGYIIPGLGDAGDRCYGEKR
ncbi:MAG: uracil phosphoribosyltransferase, partial [Chlamydiota bacterium]